MSLNPCGCGGAPMKRTEGGHPNAFSKVFCMKCGRSTERLAHGERGEAADAAWNVLNPKPAEPRP